MKKIVVTIEARMTSSRLPRKVLLDLAGRPALEQMIIRAKKSSKVHDVIVATTVNETDDPIVELCKKIGCNYFRGDEHDVLKRVLDTALHFNATHIVELTGDCPLVDPIHIDKVIDFYFSGSYDYVSNRLETGLPDGFDVQLFSTEALASVEKMTKDPVDRVHVSCFFYNNPQKFKLGYAGPRVGDEDYWPDLAITLDESKDYLLLQEIFNEAKKHKDFFSVKEILAFLKRNPKLIEINKSVVRKEVHEG